MVAPVLLRAGSVPTNPGPGHLVSAALPHQSLPKVAVGDWRPSRIPPAGRNPPGQMVDHRALDILRIGHHSDRAWLLQGGKADNYSLESIRLLVVPASLPDSSLSAEPHRSTHAQPPGPGFPRHDPSVNSITCFIDHLRHPIREVAAVTSATSESVRFFNPSSVSLPSDASLMTSARRLPVLSAIFLAA